MAASAGKTTSPAQSVRLLVKLNTLLVTLPALLDKLQALQVKLPALQDQTACCHYCITSLQLKPRYIDCPC